MIRRLYVNGVHALRRVLSKTGALEWLEHRESRFAIHIRSLFSIYDARDLASLDLPWWTYKAIDQVEAFLETRPGARVFEYGAGASTLWLSKRASSVVSVEHDTGFAETMTTLLAESPNVEFRVVQPTQHSHRIAAQSQRQGSQNLDFADYASSVHEFDGRFDLIVIDGRARMACLLNAVEKLSDDGIMIFDDILRRRYRAAREVEGLDCQVTFGWAPTLPTPTSTAILSRSESP